VLGAVAEMVDGGEEMRWLLLHPMSCFHVEHQWMKHPMTLMLLMEMLLMIDQQGMEMEIMCCLVQVSMLQQCSGIVAITVGIEWKIEAEPVQMLLLM